MGRPSASSYMWICAWARRLKIAREGIGIFPTALGFPLFFIDILGTPIGRAGRQFTDWLWIRLPPGELYHAAGTSSHFFRWKGKWHKLTAASTEEGCSCQLPGRFRAVAQFGRASRYGFGKVAGSNPVSAILKAVSISYIETAFQLYKNWHIVFYKLE